MEYNGYSNGGTKDLSSCIGEFFGSENDLSQSEDDFRKTGALIHPSTKLVNNGVNHYRLTAVPLSQSEAERTCATEERIWEETDGGERDELWKTSTERNFVSVPDGDNRGPSSSDVSENFNYCTSDAVQTTESTWDKRRLNENHVSIRHSDFPRCRYILGHNKYPEVVNKKSDVTAVLPSFWSTFSAYGTNNKVYSLCRNSFTGTTETHVSPIMISTYAKQYTHGNSQLTSNVTIHLSRCLLLHSEMLELNNNKTFKNFRIRKKVLRYHARGSILTANPLSLHFLSKIVLTRLGTNIPAKWSVFYMNYSWVTDDFNGQITGTF